MFSRGASVFLAVLVFPWSTLVDAQPAEAARSTVSRHHQALFEVMKDMTREMSMMTDQLTMGEVTAEQDRDIAQRMERMSSLMQRMSGLLARPAMSEPEFRGQMEEMRKQMSSMKREPAAASQEPAVGPAAEVDRRMTDIETALDRSEAQMGRIRGMSDPKERARLLREHGQAIREIARDLRAMDDPFSRTMRSMMAGGERAPSSEAMMTVHALIARRIALMDRVMEQIMEQSMQHQEPFEKR